MDLKMCRICCENEGVSYVFNDIVGEPQISAKIMYCCSKVRVAPGDGLPARVCARCEAALDAAYRLVLRAEAADAALRAAAAASLAPAPVPEEHCDDGCAPAEVERDAEVKEETGQKRQYKKRAGAGAVAGEHACVACGKTYAGAAGLRRHAARQHGGGEGARERNFTCERCGKGFYSRNDVKVHARTHTGETPYACGECGRRFTQASALLRHRRRHAGLKPHACDACAKPFCTKEELKHHQRVHSSEKSFACAVCAAPFKYRNNLNKHMALHVRPAAFVCAHCGRAFNQKGNLKSHVERQHSARAGACAVCRRSVPDVERHMWRHTGQRPLQCAECPSRFFERKSLARHVNFRHSAPRRHACAAPGCGRAFPSRPMLRYHEARQHAGAPPHPCDRCARAFYRRNDLARHKIGTHKERLT